MAEQQTGYEYGGVDLKEMTEERQESWNRFCQFITWSIAATVVVLVLLAIFVA